MILIFFIIMLDDWFLLQESVGSYFFRRVISELFHHLFLVFPTQHVLIVLLQIVPDFMCAFQVSVQVIVANQSHDVIKG